MENVHGDVEYVFLLRSAKQFQEDLVEIRKMVGSYNYDSMLEMLSHLEAIREVIDDISNKFISERSPN